MRSTLTGGGFPLSIHNDNIRRAFSGCHSLSLDVPNLGQLRAHLANIDNQEKSLLSLGGGLVSFELFLVALDDLALGQLQFDQQAPSVARGEFEVDRPPPE